MASQDGSIRSILPTTSPKGDDTPKPWRQSVPQYWKRNSLKWVVGLVILIALGESLYIHQLRMGLTRVPNDPFDSWFGERISHSSPEVWAQNRQSFLRRVRPVPVHSHNDYSRRLPLFEALGSGCISIEADVHLRGSSLLVGHGAAGLSDDKTLKTLYLEPLRRILDAQNAHITTGGGGGWKGLFDSKPGQTLTLLIDLKTSGPETFAEVDAQLQPLRDLGYLTYWNGTSRIMRPLTVVASGNAPFASVLGLNETRRDIFWDADLNLLVSPEDDFTTDPPTFKYNISNSYFASTRFQNARLPGFSGNSDLDERLPWENSPEGKDRAASQIEQAKSRGLLARYWDTPSSPSNLQEIVWRVLVDHDVGVLNMDDLGTVRARAKGWGQLNG